MTRTYADCTLTRSRPHQFDTIFSDLTALSFAALRAEPFSGNTPPPSGQTMQVPPADSLAKRLTLHLPPRGACVSVTQ